MPISLLRDHPARSKYQEAVALLPDSQYEAIYRLTALHELPWDTVMGLNLAFYRTFAAPRIAALLDQTGETVRNPTKRSIDTGLFMYDLIASGVNTPRGHEIARRLNQMHRRWDIAEEDYRYILATFIVVPTRWINDVGWRRLSEKERDASLRFYLRLGDLMNISGMPTTYAGVEQLFDNYEKAELAPTPAGARLMTATQGVIADRLPRPLRFLARPLTRATLSPELCRCLGLPPAGRILRHSFRLALRVRAVVVGRMAPRDQPWFTPGRTLSLYPAGYQLSDLGPK